MNKDAKFFTTSYYYSVEYPVKQCSVASCETIFAVKSKVSTKKPVYVCKEAVNSQNKCVWALCVTCYSILNEVETTSGSCRRRRSSCTKH